MDATRPGRRGICVDADACDWFACRGQCLLHLPLPTVLIPTLVRYIHEPTYHYLLAELPYLQHHAHGA